MHEETDARDNGFFAALHVRPFVFVWISSVLSGSGQWTLVIARGWLVLKLTDSAGWVGLTLFASWIPYLFATPIGGLLADRFERRRVSAVMQGVSLIAAIALALLTIWGVVQPWEVLALAVLAGIGRSMETPSTTALIPTLVPSKYLLNAISLNSSATFGSQFLGAAVASIVLLLGGTVGEVFVVTAILYGTAMVLILLSGARPLPARVRENPWRETVHTWKYIGATAMIPMLILLGALHCGLTMSKDAILPGFTKNLLHGNGSTLSLLQMGFGAGSMAGTFALGGLRTEEAKGPLFLISGLASGLTVVVMAFARAPLLAFLLLALMGASQGMFMALGNTLVQQVVPDHLRGRVTSAYTMATGGMMSAGTLGAGALADGLGITMVLVVPALVFVFVVLALSVARPSLRTLYRNGVLPGVDVAAAAHPVAV